MDFGGIADRQFPLPPTPTCDASYAYRSLDGTCNNLNNPQYGQANTIYQRLMGPATYADGNVNNNIAYYCLNTATK